MLIIISMRRKSDNLFPFEISILEAAKELLRPGDGGFYGFQIANAIKDREAKHFLSGYGTLYRSLGRLEKLGFLSSHWEDADIAHEQKRPPRKMYEFTGKTAPVASECVTERPPADFALEGLQL